MTPGTTIRLELTDEEAVLLRDTLAEYLADLPTEIAGTEATDFAWDCSDRSMTLERIRARFGRAR